MLRSNSSAKWKQVLGFDDGLGPPGVLGPPPDSAKSEFDRPETPEPPAPTYQSRFPRDIAFTRTKQQDLYLSPSPPTSNTTDTMNKNTRTQVKTPKPLFYAAIQEDTSSPTVDPPKPDIILHAGPSKSAQIISFATFYPVTQSTEITLCLLPSLPTSSSSNSLTPEPKNFSLPSHRRFKTEKLVSTGGIFTTEKHAFYHNFPTSLVREKFEWRQSTNSIPLIGIEVKEKDNGSSAWKLVRISTAESVAVYEGVRRKEGGTRLVGMFRFLGGDEMGRVINGSGLGEDLEVLALVSLLAVLERGRRAVVENRLALGVD